MKSQLSYRNQKLSSSLGMKKRSNQLSRKSFQRVSVKSLNFMVRHAVEKFCAACIQFAWLFIVGWGEGHCWSMYMLNLVKRLGKVRVNVFRTFVTKFQAKSICWFCWMKITIVLSIRKKLWVWEYHFIVVNSRKEWYYICNFVLNMRRWWVYGAA